MSKAVQKARTEDLAESPALNGILLRNARKSMNEISELTGIPADEVSERLTRLLDERNWRDDLQEEKLLLFELGQLVEDIRERMRTASTDEDYGSMARAQLAGIKLMLDQIASRRKAIDGDLARVTREQARMIADAMMVAAELAVAAIEKSMPGVPGDVVRDAFEGALPQAIVIVESRRDER